MHSGSPSEPRYPQAFRALALYYQPIIDTTTGEIVAAEALLRWNDPTRGVVSPASILPRLASSKLMVPLGSWVLHQVAADCCRWREAGCVPIRVSINVLRSQLRSAEFIEACLATTAAWADGKYGLDIELTEEAFRDDEAEAMRNLKRLRAAGIRVAIENFGTGRSAIGWLSNLPVDVLKIDRSFTARLPGNERTASVVTMIVRLARSLKLTTIAEGVETPEQFEWIKQVGCDGSQGFLHYRPVSRLDLERILRKRRAGESHATAGRIGTQELLHDIEHLIDSLVASIGYVPANAEPMGSPTALPSRLRALTKTAASGSTWRAWRAGSDIHFVQAQLCPKATRPRRPAVQACFYDADGGLTTAGVWVLRSDGEWRLHDSIAPRPMAPVDETTRGRAAVF